MQGLMRSLIVVVLGGVMAACTPTPGASPTPEVSVTPSVTPTPTPQWTEDQQMAIDTVHKCLEVTSRIQQNLLDRQWDDVYTVAADQALDDTLAAWADRLVRSGWWLVPFSRVARTGWFVPVGRRLRLPAAQTAPTMWPAPRDSPHWMSSCAIRAHLGW